MTFDEQNMGQRYVQLENTYTGYDNNTATLHVRQLPPNPAILAPGPAYIFVVVKGVPSVGVPVMIGSGKLEKQPTSPPGDLPDSLIIQVSGGKAEQSTPSTALRVSGSSIWGVCASVVVLIGVTLGW